MVTLTNGRVLLIGGIMNVPSFLDHWSGKPSTARVTSSVEEYNPATQSWRDVEYLHFPRMGHTATMLSDGRVVVAGGTDEHAVPVPWVEVYDPENGKWSVTSPLSTPWDFHVAAVLSNALVVAGGHEGVSRQDTHNTELLDTTKICSPADCVGESEERLCQRI
jgi:N-acetylneuraminic acid mutarotase